MTSAITNLANFTGFHTGINICNTNNLLILILITLGHIIGVHNSSEIMSAEIERRNLNWQELRKSVKQNYLREQEKYEEDIKNLNQKYNELMDKIDDRYTTTIIATSDVSNDTNTAINSDGSDISLNRYTRKIKNKMKENDGDEISDVKYLLTKQFEKVTVSLSLSSSSLSSLLSILLDDASTTC